MPDATLLNSDAVPTASAAEDPASTSPTGGKRLVLLHFNDVYNIEPSTREPVGGAARFAAVVKSMAADNPLLVFSGDAFSPSILSTIMMGEQMPPVLNKLGVQVSCVGNHDFDFGTPQFMKLAGQCNFPWLMANIYDKTTGRPYADVQASCIIEWNGVKVGFVGLVEEEWIQTLSVGAVRQEDILYIDFMAEGHRQARELKAQGAELLVAITHMRLPNDRRVAAELPEYDIVLGGHDHDYVVEQQQEQPNSSSLLVKSGTDFRDLTRVDVTLPGGGARPQLSWSRSTITGEIKPDPEMDEIVERSMGALQQRLSKVIGHSTTDLDGRFATVRTRESNLGNFICDVLRNATDTDAVMMQGGGFRSDTIHPAGDLTLSDLLSIMPKVDSMLVLEATGRQILAALENGVSATPKKEGRFPQVSGIRFKFSPAAAAGHRVLPDSVLIGGEPLLMDKAYRLCTSQFMAEGFDGYAVLKECRVLVDIELGVTTPTVIQNHFVALEVISLMNPHAKAQLPANTWLSRIAKRQKRASDSVAQPDHAESADADAAADSPDQGPTPDSNGGKGDATLCVLHNGRYSIAPVIDGRITAVE